MRSADNKYPAGKNQPGIFFLRENGLQTDAYRISLRS